MGRNATAAVLCLLLMVAVNYGGWVMLRKDVLVEEPPPPPLCTPSPTPTPSRTSVLRTGGVVYVPPLRRTPLLDDMVFDPDRPHGPPDWLASHKRRERGERLATVSSGEETECGRVTLYSHAPPAGEVVLLWPEDSAFRELIRTSDLSDLLVFDQSESLLGRVAEVWGVARRPGLPDLLDLVVELECSRPAASEWHRQLREEPFPAWVAEFHFGFSVAFQPDDDHDNLRRSVSDLHLSVHRRKAPLLHITHVMAPLQEGEELQEDVMGGIRAAYKKAWAAGVRVQVVAVADEEEAALLRYPIEEPATLFRCDCGEGDDMPKMFLSHALDTVWRQGNSEYVLVTSRNVALSDDAYLTLWQRHSKDGALLLEHAGDAGPVVDGSLYLPFSWAMRLDARGLRACSVAVQLTRLGTAKRKNVGVTTHRGVPPPAKSLEEELLCEFEAEALEWRPSLHVNGRLADAAAREHLDQMRQPLKGLRMVEEVPSKFHRLINLEAWQVGKGENLAPAALSFGRATGAANRMLAVLCCSPEESGAVRDLVMGLSGIGEVALTTYDREKELELVKLALSQPDFVSFPQRFASKVVPVAEQWGERAVKHMLEPSHMFYTAMRDLYMSAFSAPPYRLEVVHVQRGVVGSIGGLLACQAALEGKAPAPGLWHASGLCYYRLDTVRNPSVLAIALLPESDPRFEQIYRWMGGVVPYVFNAMAAFDAYEAELHSSDGAHISTVWYADLLADGSAVQELVNSLFAVRFYSPLETPPAPARPHGSGPSAAVLLDQVARFVLAYRDHNLWLPSPSPRDTELCELWADPEVFLLGQN